MFHPHLLRLFFGNRNALADAMGLVSALKVEEDLQRAGREEREQQLQSDVERIPEHGLAAVLNAVSVHPINHLSGSMEFVKICELPVGAAGD